MLTKELIKQIAPRSDDKIVEDLVFYFNKHFAKYEINTKLRQAHFLAQAAHESDGFRTLEEYASGLAYEGRKDLGNNVRGDGKRFKGRGIFQLTGRANYTTFGLRLGYDLVNNPELAKTPEVSVLTALEYWKDRKLNTFADNDDVNTITRRINGGLNGFEDRKKYLAVAKRVIPEGIKAPEKKK
jgi:putative chitinase